MSSNLIEILLLSMIREVITSSKQFTTRKECSSLQILNLIPQNVAIFEIQLHHSLVGEVLNCLIKILNKEITLKFEKITQINYRKFLENLPYRSIY